MSTIKVDTITTRTGSGNITISNDITGGVTLVGANTLTLRNDTSTDSNEPKLIFDNDTFAGANHANITTGNGGLLMKIESPSTSTFQNRHQILMNAGGGDDIQFNSSTNNGTSYTTQMKIEAGNVTIGNGNLVIGTSGKGIDFSAAGNTGGMTSELLDDYEEGSFVPILKHEVGDALTVGYASGYTYGRYTKVGSLVTFQLTIDVDSVSGGASNQQLVVPNLPFTSKSYQTNSNGGANMTYLLNLNTNITYGIVLGSSTTLRFYSAPGTASLGNTVTSSTHIQCYGQYETDA